MGERETEGSLKQGTDSLASAGSIMMIFASQSFTPAGMASTAVWGL